MIEARNIKIVDNVATLEYKSDINRVFIKLKYDIEKMEIIEISKNELSSTESYWIYSKLMLPIIKLHKENKLTNTFKNIWY